MTELPRVLWIDDEPHRLVPWQRAVSRMRPVSHEVVTSVAAAGAVDVQMFAAVVLDVKIPSPADRDDTDFGYRAGLTVAQRLLTRGLARGRLVVLTNTAEEGPLKWFRDAGIPVHRKPTATFEDFVASVMNAIGAAP